MTHFYKLVFFVIAAVTCTNVVQAQTLISGKVVDITGLPVKGASVYLDNTIDGATTDSSGNFHFTTSETGNQTIMATCVNRPPAGEPIVVMGDMKDLVITMKSAAKELKSVTITAGAFEASNDRTKTILTPLDIVTTAGANADVVKAMQTLPGVQQTGTENGLFVRGGDASEAAIIIDGVVVQNAFFSGPPGVTTRSRFGPFSFQGVSFSSGGYSARYGQALSAVLELNSTDLPEKSTMNLGVSTGAFYASGTKKWKKSALDFGGSYLNLAPFYSIATTNFKFYNPPTGGTANARYVWKPNKDGIFKASFNTNYTQSGIAIPNPYAGVADTGVNKYNPFVNQGDTLHFTTKDQYYFANLCYKQTFKKKYQFYTAAAYSYDQTNNKFGTLPINETDQRAQFRAELKDYITSRMNVLVGTDVQHFGIQKNIFDTFKQQFNETQPAVFAEGEWTPLYWLAIKPGIRYEHSTLLGTDKIAPRLSMAFRTDENSQISLAYGIFYQDPGNNYLLAGLAPQLKLQEAEHYIINWQWSKHDRTFRVEAYAKNYANLVLEQSAGNTYFDPNSYRVILDTAHVSNNGYGYATGFELFWRDKKTVKNLDYWISYSFINTKRLYSNYPYEATPPFIANNNLNLVTKYFVDKWHTNFSATYTWASGYPYYNPEALPITSSNFYANTTPPFNNLAISIAYLHSFGRWFSVFYISIDNVTNAHNVFGYRYNYDNNGNAVGSPSPIVPALYRSIFAGVNISLTQFKKDEL